MLELHNMVIVIRSFFHERNKHYSQDFLDRCVCKVQILEYDKINVSEQIDINKINALRECIICECWYFREMSFLFQPKVCDGCHDVMQKAMSFNEVVIVSAKGND